MGKGDQIEQTAQPVESEGVAEAYWTTYDQAREQLATVGFDLDAAKRRHVEEKIRWGWIQSDRAESEERLLEREAKISSRAIQKIIQAIQEGKKFQLIFSFDGYSSVGTLDSIGGKPELLLHREFGRAASDFGFLQDFKIYQPAEKLLKMFSQLVRSDIPKLYMSEDLAIIFTPDDREVPDDMRGKSPNEYWHIDYISDDREAVIAREGRLAGIFQNPDIELLRPLE